MMIPDLNRRLISRYLVESAIGHTQAATMAWKKLQSIDVLKELDSSETQIIPQIIDNLSTLGYRDSKLDALEFIFSSHRRRLDRIHSEIPYTIKTLNILGIKPVLLKGTALLQHFPKACRGRQMSDIDLMVPIDKREFVIEKLINLGWKLDYNYRFRKFNFNHAFSLTTPNQVSVDIHWYLNLEDMSQNSAHLFNSNSILREEAGLTFRVPTPTLLFYHMMLHGARNSASNGLQWIVDCSLLAQFPIDYFEILRLATHAKLNSKTLHGLVCLTQFNIPVPEVILTTLTAHRPGHIERFQFEMNGFTHMPLKGKSIRSAIEFCVKCCRLWRFRFQLEERKFSFIELFKYYANAPTVKTALIKCLKCLFWGGAERACRAQNLRAAKSLDRV